ncbi:hypothetical protein BRD56_09675 [Thermoplasmatales archaeon SW_10_69_26]|nr:MAG: hypothetical protein BRD56_09675 [Thermoplasmatales archaeon SW_10_69_26]
MAETLARPARRGAIGLAYGLGLALLMQLVAGDVAWVEQALLGASELAPPLLGPDEATLGFAIAFTGGFATLVGLGTFLVSGRTGTGFGLWTVATVAVLTLPYGRVPWARLGGGQAGATLDPPAQVWLVSAGLVALATVEMGICARERVLAELERRGLGGPLADRATRAAAIRWLVVSGLAGATLVLAFALLAPLTERFAGNLDLVWAPALAGLVAGVALWLLARE